MRRALAMGVVTAAAAFAQPDATELVRRAADKYAAAKQFELAATIQVTNRRKSDGEVLRERTLKMHVAAAPAGRVRLETEGEGVDGVDVYSDGKSSWEYARGANEYAAVEAGGDAVRGAMEMARIALGQAVPAPGASGKLVREEKVAAAECWVMEVHDVAAPPEGRMVWIDEKRMVVVRQEESLTTGGVIETTRADYTTVRLDERIPDGLFVFVPPEGAKRVERLVR